MRVDNHELHLDFPQYAQRIHALRHEDAHFARLLAEYEKVTEEIRGYEKADVPVADDWMEKLKYTRLSLKDKLYSYLTGKP
jgi:uncharacterized protein YdcH (DUF465 family)